MNIVGVSSWTGRWLTFLSYFATLATLIGLLAFTPTELSLRAFHATLPAWSGETPTRLFGKWSLFNLPPTLLFVIFHHRRVRAVAPLVLSFITVVTAGVLSIIMVSFIYPEISTTTVDSVTHTLGVSVIAALIGYLVLFLAIACILSCALGWHLLLQLRRSYQRKRTSDQSLRIDAMWLIFASYYSALLAFGGPGWALSALVAFSIYKVAVNTGNRRLRTSNYGEFSFPTLLVLRVFSLGKRSEFLFNAITRHWRYVGSVQLIAGVDLALSTITPNQFLAFVSGNLNRIFVSNEIAIDRGLAELDTTAGPNGSESGFPRRASRANLTH